MKLHYFKELSSKINLINEKKKQYKHIVYLMPKKFYDELSDVLEGVEVYFYENLSKTNDPINNARSESLLIIDNSARYKNVGSDKFRRIARISKQYQHKILIDSAPFAGNIEYLYVPLSYIDRNILGYQHYYSFRENNSEMYQGKQYRSHDLWLNAQKMANITEMDYSSFLDGIEVVTKEVALSDSERAGYEDKKQACFKKYNKFNPIVTALCDYSNMQESVYNAIEKLLDEQAGQRNLLYTNIKSHNRILKKRFPGAEIRTFYDVNSDESDFDNIILCEVPIVKSYLFVDVLSRLKRGTKVWIIKPNTPAIKLVYQRMNDEYTQLDDFTKTLRKEIDDESRREKIS